MGISTNPTNQNLAQPSKFLLSFDRLPNLTFFCTGVNLPGISMGEAVQQTPFIDAPIPGDKIVYDTLEISFLIDEQLTSWMGIHDWMIGLGFPESFDQYKNLPLQQRIQMKHEKPQYSDAIITIYSNKNNPVLQVRFIDLFPINLGSMSFNTADSAEAVMTSTASFKYTNYHIQRF
jgi:hypothetical protein